MNEKKTINASTIARIAGNIMAGFVSTRDLESARTEQQATAMAYAAVNLARRIVAEVERTEPVAEPPQP